MRLERTVDIAAVPDQGFAADVDVTRRPEWTEPVTSVERLDAASLVAGARAWTASSGGVPAPSPSATSGSR